MNTKDFDWEREFDKLFMYDRGDYKEFDILKAGNIGVLIEFIRTVRQHGIQADRQQLLKAVEEMKEELPTILWKDEHEPNLIKRAKNHALDQVLDLLKAKDYIQEFDNQIPREGL